MQDSRGFLWFSTGLGICRFNGYEFTRPVDTSATATGTKFQIVEDAGGRIWYMNLDASLSIIENDTVRSWAYSDLSKSFRKNNTTYRFAVGKDGTVWVPSMRSGFLVVQPNGVKQIVPALNRNVTIFSEIDGQVIVGGEGTLNVAADDDFMLRTGQTREMIHWHHGKAVSMGRFPADHSKGGNIRPRIWRLKNGGFILCYRQSFYVIANNRLIWHGQKNGAAETIFEDTDGSILMAVSQGKNQGLLRFGSLALFERDEFDNLLPGQDVVQVLRDREGGWWATTRESGIFYCKYPDLERFDTSDGLPVEDVKALTSDGREKVYAGMRNLDIAVFQRSGGRPKLLPPPPVSGMQTLRFDSSTGRLWCGNDLCFLENGHWNFAERIVGDKKTLRHIPVKKLTFDPTGASLWASAAFNFFSIDPNTGEGVEMFQDSFSNTRTFSVTPDEQGNLWVTIVEGLRLYRNGRYELPPFHHPALRFPARNMELLPPVAGGGMVIALLGGGLLLRDTSGKFTHLTTRNGMTSDVLSNLYVAPNGWIYACSNTGLNIISPNKFEYGGWRASTLTMKHGLPSNQINDVSLMGDEIWIATDKGIARFRGKPKPALMPPPILEKFAFNNQDTAFTPNLRFAFDQNNITLRFFALHFRSSGDIPYRYRLLGADTTFVFTRTREVNFANLATGNYTFEVQAQNEDGQWSDSSKWAFAILPPWWATWWFRTLVAAVLAAALYLFYQNRLQSIRQEAAEQEKIRDLETAALRAQMNPHFIFNCLQAIQSYILQNDRDAATTYLARFAKLVRLALHGSVDGHHSLAEEIAMLDNYLHLEQMRFGGKFTFSIRAEGLDLDEISLPPLLVQPFVENALIHGLQGRESGGLVEVVFASKGNLLEVAITDNGQGFSEKNALEKTAHKSVGMMLTQKRLDMLTGGGKGGSEHFVRETVLDENGIAVGARVQILIPI